MVRVGDFIRTLVSRLIFIVLIVLMLVPFGIFCMLPDKTRRKSWLVYKVVHWFYWITLKASFLPIAVKGLKNLPKEPSVFVANHQSSFDIPILGSLCGGASHIWVARSELEQLVMLRVLLGCFAIVVDVNSPRKALRSLLRIIGIAKSEKTHIMVFPEGQRHSDGKVHDFFGGFALMAKKTGRPVTPVYIDGLHKVYPYDAFYIRRHPVTVVVGPSFCYQENEDDDQFKKRVYDWFVEQSTT